MIQLDVEDYCQECLDFDPKAHKMMVHGPVPYAYDTQVFCKHRQRCDRIAKWMKTNRTGDENNGSGVS